MFLRCYISPWFLQTPKSEILFIKISQYSNIYEIVTFALDILYIWTYWYFLLSWSFWNTSISCSNKGDKIVVFSQFIKAAPTLTCYKFGKVCVTRSESVQCIYSYGHVCYSNYFLVLKQVSVLSSLCLDNIASLEVTTLEKYLATGASFNITKVIIIQ